MSARSSCTRVRISRVASGASQSVTSAIVAMIVSPNSATGRASATPLMPAAIIATISLSENSRLTV